MPPNAHADAFPGEIQQEPARINGFVRIGGERGIRTPDTAFDRITV